MGFRLGFGVRAVGVADWSALVPAANFSPVQVSQFLTSSWLAALCVESGDGNRLGNQRSAKQLVTACPWWRLCRERQKLHVL